MTNHTPAMQQYHDIKKEYPDSIIFFRMGDFYEMFGEDAHIAHKVLGINITSRNKNASNPEALAGIPYHAKDKYLPSLIEAGYKVAIVEQVSDPKLKGIVKREVVRVVTPATLSLEGDTYDQYADRSLLLALTRAWDTFGISLVEIVSNTWKTTQFSNLEDFQKELSLIHPNEVILDRRLYQDEGVRELVTKKYSLAISYFPVPAKPTETLLAHFWVKDLTGFGIQEMPQAVEASALLLSYLELNQKQSLTCLRQLAKYSCGDYLEMDASTIKNLDLLYNAATGSAQFGTLYGVLAHTKTPMGKRYLRENLIRPLSHFEQLQERQAFVETFFQNSWLLDRVREKLSSVGDIDVLLNRIALKRATPNDLNRLKDALQALVEIRFILRESGNEQLLSYFE